MYVLNNNEKGILRVIIRNARADYFRNNKYFFNEETIEDKVICSEERFEEEIIERNAKIEDAEVFEKLFTDQEMSKYAKKVLTYDEKLVLFLYFVEGKTDEEIAETFDLYRTSITRRRNKAIDKLKEKYNKGE